MIRQPPAMVPAAMVREQTILIQVGTSGERSLTFLAATVSGALPAFSADSISVPRLFSQSVTFAATIVPITGIFVTMRASSAARRSLWVAAARVDARWAACGWPVAA